MNAILDALGRMPVGEAVAWMLVENLLLFAFALMLGRLLVLAYRSRQVGPPPLPVEAREVALAFSCVGLNTFVTLVGWWLWRLGVIVVRRDTGVRAWLDAAVLLLVMDLAMYVTHRIAHLPWVYPVVHATHHHYDRPRPLDLFVLNPLEVLGFGGLWLTVIWAYSSSWLGMVVYLALNLIFGVIGHLGVEPFPRSWAARPVLRHLGTSTFHAGHHHDRGGNFGFYTLIWDRLFGTLHQDCGAPFGIQAAESPASVGGGP